MLSKIIEFYNRLDKNKLINDLYERLDDDTNCLEFSFS
jgi:hypothetical protein